MCVHVILGVLARVAKKPQGCASGAHSLAESQKKHSGVIYTWLTVVMYGKGGENAPAYAYTKYTHKKVETYKRTHIHTREQSASRRISQDSLSRKCDLSAGNSTVVHLHLDPLQRFLAFQNSSPPKLRVFNYARRSSKGGGIFFPYICLFMFIFASTARTACF